MADRFLAYICAGDLAALPRGLEQITYIINSEKGMGATMPEVTNAQQRSLELVKEFYAAKERHDLDAVTSLLADDVVYNFPLNATGTPEPWFTYDGKPATVAYQRVTLARFSRIHMVDPEYTVSPTGDLVFATMTGDYVQEDGDRSYNNVYVFRSEVADGKTKRVDEYANPVTFAKLAGLPIG